MKNKEKDKSQLLSNQLDALEKHLKDKRNGDIWETSVSRKDISERNKLFLNGSSVDEDSTCLSMPDIVDGIYPSNRRDSCTLSEPLSWDKHKVSDSLNINKNESGPPESYMSSYRVLKHLTSSCSSDLEPLSIENLKGSDSSTSLKENGILIYPSAVRSKEDLQLTNILDRNGIFAPPAIVDSNKVLGLIKSCDGDADETTHVKQVVCSLDEERQLQEQKEHSGDYITDKYTKDTLETEDPGKRFMKVASWDEIEEKCCWNDKEKVVLASERDTEYVVEMDEFDKEEKLYRDSLETEKGEKSQVISISLSANIVEDMAKSKSSISESNSDDTAHEFEAFTDRQMPSAETIQPQEDRFFISDGFLSFEDFSSMESVISEANWSLLRNGLSLSLEHCTTFQVNIQFSATGESFISNNHVQFLTSLSSKSSQVHPCFKKINISKGPEDTLLDCPDVCLSSLNYVDRAKISKFINKTFSLLQSEQDEREFDDCSIIRKVKYTGDLKDSLSSDPHDSAVSPGYEEHRYAGHRNGQDEKKDKTPSERTRKSRNIKQNLHHVTSRHLNRQRKQKVKSRRRHFKDKGRKRQSDANQLAFGKRKRRNRKGGLMDRNLKWLDCSHGDCPKELKEPVIFLRLVRVRGGANDHHEGCMDGGTSGHGSGSREEKDISGGQNGRGHGNGNKDWGGDSNSRDSGGHNTNGRDGDGPNKDGGSGNGERDQGNPDDGDDDDNGGDDEEDDKSKGKKDPEGRNVPRLDNVPDPALRGQPSGGDERSRAAHEIREAMAQSPSPGEQEAADRPPGLLTEEGEEEHSVEHTAMSIDHICDVIGMATSGPPVNVAPEVGDQFNVCLSENLHQLSNLSPRELDAGSGGMGCCLCIVLSGLLTHMADTECSCRAGQCNQCSQAFHLIMWHAQLCIQANRKKSRISSSDLCYKICKSSDWKWEKLHSNADRLRVKVKKYCAKVLGSSPAEPAVGATGMSELDHREDGSSTGPPTSSNTSLSLGGNLVTSPAEEPGELEHLPSYSFTSAALHSALVISGSQRDFHPSGASSLSQTPDHMGAMAVMPASPVVPATGPLSRAVGSALSSGPEQKEPEVHKTPLSRKSSQRRAAVIPQPIPEETGEASEPKDDIAQLIYSRFAKGDDPYETQPTYGVTNRIESMPIGRVHDEEQFMSLWNRRKGVPGVGEVVFGHLSQLRIVAAFFEKKREECEQTGICPYQLREEGVILAEHKDKFHILRTRYQKHQQWERVAHLGNGMSGKCHLAIDLKTKFKFCCKKVHLLRYEEEELRLSSEVHHPYVVRMFGAIRHGVKVYIFSEFIDGGSLESCIREQKLLGRRLSHWTAITYFQQLLQVLAYLQSKNMLHEDIKADNILLRRDSPFIAVTDFGVSRRLHDPKELKNKSPVGSPTHWSPEKASMEGHGFPSDLWAAVCVLVHMLSGEPPWLKRFQRAAILNFIIYARPPPMEDVPDDVQAVVRDLIEKGFVKNPEHRPSASELLTHSAFRMLDDGTPQNYYSTLMCHSVAEGRQQNAGDTEQTSRNIVTTALANTTESNVLYSTNIAPSQCQESDKRMDPERRQRDVEAKNGQTDLHTDQRQRDVLPTVPTVVLTAEESGSSERSGDVSTIVGHSDNSAQHSNESVNSTTMKNEGQLVGATVQGPTVIIGATAHEPALTAEKNAFHYDQNLKELMCPDLERLLPKLDDLIPSSAYSDTTSSIRSFFEDKYPTVDFVAKGMPALRYYRPEPEPVVGDPLPKLSIFEIPKLDTSSEHDKELVETSSHPELAAQNSQRKELPSHSMLKFQLSSEPEELNSFEMFGPGPDLASEAVRKISAAKSKQQSESHGGEVAPLSPSSPSAKLSGGSNHSLSGLQQKKPSNLKLNVPDPGSSRLAASTAHPNEGESKRSKMWPPTSDYATPQTGFTPGSGLLSSTPRKHDISTSGSTGSSQQAFFLPSRGNSVIDEQERHLQELQAELEDNVSQSSSDNEKLAGVLNSYSMEDEEDEVTEAAASEDTDSQCILERIQSKLGEPKIGGHKLNFYNSQREFMFDARVLELPVIWRHFIDEVRRRIRRHGLDHFTLMHPHGKRVDFDRSFRDKDVIVVALTSPHRDCWCMDCEMLNFRPLYQP
ncbi:uncharacterized protein LOC101854452 [Aplysia californica]|uniref:Uncharacterized protein LOC101854452 n=1 Tax=Aplysia californica TaxID=6500 RepID=A0ABM1ABH1_APLCA|nr:uncharacterized protein LOC101854452 [Aplysia californica]